MGQGFLKKTFCIRQAGKSPGKNRKLRTALNSRVNTAGKTRVTL